MKKSILLFLLLSVGVASTSAQVRLRANALAYATVTPNIGLEVGITKHITAVVEGYLAPVWNSSDFQFKGYLITPELRYYFCESFNKHYVGIHGNFGKFNDLHLLNKHGYRKDAKTIGAGVTYGHQWILNHRWSLDIFGGIGWWQFKGDVYSKCDEKQLIAKNHKKNVFGPSRLGVAFGYRF